VRLRPSLFPVLGLVAIVAATAIGVVLVASSRGGGDHPASTSSLPGKARELGDQAQQAPLRDPLPDGIDVHGLLEPSIILFGDTIKARVDVMLDRRKVDAGSVRVAANFVPWEIVGEPARTRRDSGARTYLRTTYTLRCLSGPCLPGNQSSALDFDRGRVSFVRLGSTAGARESKPISWPTLLVYSRFAAATLASPREPLNPNPNPWRADLVSFPAVSYRVAPGFLLAALLGAAAVLVAAGAALAYRAIPRRGPPPPPEPEPEPEPEPVLTPLEQALVLLEDASRANGAEDRRRALELVAEVLERDHSALARAAKALAWSEDDPLVEETSGLATRVRSTIDLNGDSNAS
jgi:hypothetical protein